MIVAWLAGTDSLRSPSPKIMSRPFTATTIFSVAAMGIDAFVVRHKSSGVPWQISRWTEAFERHEKLNPEVSYGYSGHHGVTGILAAAGPGLQLADVPEGAEIVQLPASSPDDHGADVNWTVTLGADGSGDVSGEERHTGDAAFWLRSNLSQAEARAQYVEDALVGPWFPTVEVEKNIEFKGDLAGGQSLVKYKAKSRGLARHEGKDLVLSLSPSNTYGSTLAPLVERTLPVQLPPHLAPSHQNRTTRILAPAGFGWGPLPPGGDANGGPFGRAHIEITKDPKDARALLIKRSVVFDMHLIPVEKYAAWRTFITQVDALMHKEVRLVPSAAGEK